jgi:hypothetical protein
MTQCRADVKESSPFLGIIWPWPSLDTCFPFYVLVCAPPSENGNRYLYQCSEMHMYVGRSMFVTSNCFLPNTWYSSMLVGFSHRSSFTHQSKQNKKWTSFINMTWSAHKNILVLLNFSCKKWTERKIAWRMPSSVSLSLHMSFLSLFINPLFLSSLILSFSLH